LQKTCSPAFFGIRAEVAMRQEPIDLDGAAPRLREVLGLAVELGMGPIARCRLTLGWLHQHTGETAVAHEQLAAAVALYRELGATFWAERAEAEFGESRWRRRCGLGGAKMGLSRPGMALTWLSRRCGRRTRLAEQRLAGRTAPGSRTICLGDMLSCDHGGDHIMKTATVREFRDRATAWLKEEEPILVTRRGKIVGFFLPATGAAVPLEIKRDIFHTLTDHLRSLIKAHGLTEETLLGEFEAARSARRRR
jgi:hypothetical protein